MNNGFEILQVKIDAIFEAQQASNLKTDKLTDAVTVLVTNSVHFEKMRAEDHRRMDKIEESVKDLRSDVFKKIASVEERVFSNTSILDQSKSSITLISIVTGATALAVLGAIFKLLFV